MQTENPGRRLVRIRPRHGTTYISQSRTVLSADRDGFIRGGSEKGLFFNQTRILSHYRYLINGEEPICNVVSNVEQHSWLGYYITSTTHDLLSEKDDGSGAVLQISQDTLELRVSRFIGEGMHEDLDLTNFTQHPAQFQLAVEFNADFADQLETILGRVQSGKLERSWKQEADHSVFEFSYYAEHSFDHQGNRGAASIQR
ncbi:MAG: glycogen debranching N-terminal domain-containing protein, partial [Acidobacteriota bacterium]